jgi:hypothetical protein
VADANGGDTPYAKNGPAAKLDYCPVQGVWLLNSSPEVKNYWVDMMVVEEVCKNGCAVG